MRRSLPQFKVALALLIGMTFQSALPLARCADTVIGFPKLASDSDRQRLVRLYISLDRSIRKMCAGNYAQSRTEAISLLSHNPPRDIREAALTVKSISAMNLRKWSEAIKSFTELDNLHRLPPELLFYMARCYSAERRYEQAEVCYSVFISEFAKRYNVRTVTPVKPANQSAAAVMSAANNASDDQKNMIMMAAAYKRRGALSELEGRFKQAAADYISAWSMETGKLAPQTVTLTQIEKGQLTAQVQRVSNAVKTGSHNANLYFDRAKAEHALGAWQAAIADYEMASKLDSANAFVYNFYEGLAYMHKNDAKTACRYLRKVFLFDPMDDETKSFTSPQIIPAHYIELLRGQSALKAVIKAGKADVDDYYDLGITELGLSDWKRAQNSFETYINKGGRGISLENAYCFLYISHRMLKQNAQAKTLLADFSKKMTSGELGQDIAQYLSGKLTGPQLISKAGRNNTRVSRVKLMMGLNALADRNFGEATRNLEWVAASDEASDDSLIANEILVGLGR